MEKIINSENLREFAYVNDAVCKRPIKGVVVWFFGLGASNMIEDELDDGRTFGEKGILYVVPYTNPWAWMNNQAVAYTDELVDVLLEKYGLSENVPIVSSGLSMGGQSALVYTIKAKRTPISCVVNCPVCDVLFHFTERKDLPRTFYSSLFNEDGFLEDALKSISPLHLVDKMPKVKYHVFHCDNDMAVNIDAHSKKLIAELGKRNFDYTFDVVRGRGHCDLIPEMKEKFSEYILEAIEGVGKS